MSNLKYRILVIDKETESRNTIVRVLKKEGFEFDLESSAIKGFTRFQKQHYDLIVSEIVSDQDEMSGLELLQKIRENDATVPFIVISDMTSVDVSVKAVNYGVVGYLMKPIEFDEAKVTILRAIRHHKSRFLKNELENYKMENVFFAVISSDEQSILKLLDTVDNLIELVFPKEYGSFPDLKMAIYEGLSNAVEHGNHRQKSKKIFFRLELKMDKIMVQIKDEGEGFDTSFIVKQKGEATGLNRGLKLIHHLMDAVSFSIKGNEINLLKLLQ
ncbi:ATP-binding protein [bacterium]|nr:ATP-binding protein [bacterium]